MAKNADILTSQEIDTFSRKLKATLAAAEASARIMQVLGNFEGAAPKAAASAKGKAKAPKAAAPAKAGKRTRKPGIATDKVLTALKAEKGGASVGTIAAKLGEKKKGRVAAALKKLRDEKKVTLKGEKRLAKWFAA